MSIQRFRDFEEARRALWTAADDPKLADRIRRLWRFSVRLAKPSAPRGVLRFRTIEEANAERERRIAMRVQTLRAERATASRPGPADARRDGLRARRR